MGRAPENSLPWAAATWVQFVAQALFGAWKNIFDKPNWQLSFVFLHSHVKPKAIHCNVDMERRLVVKVEGKLPGEASGPPCAPTVAHLGTGQSWSLPQPFWCLLTFWGFLSQPRIQTHLRLHRVAQAGPSHSHLPLYPHLLLMLPRLFPTSRVCFPFPRRTEPSAHQGLHPSSLLLLFTWRVPFHLSGHPLEWLTLQWRSHLCILSLKHPVIIIDN